MRKLACRVAFKPHPYPAREIATPPLADRVAYGRYLVNDRLGCFECHSRDFATNDALHSERPPGYLDGGNAMPDLGGKIVTAELVIPGGWGEGRGPRAGRTLRWLEPVLRGRQARLRLQLDRPREL